MEDVIMGLGWAAILLSALIGALAGWGASKIVGGHRGRYVATGVLSAVAVPVVLGLIGFGIVLAGGLIAILAVALVGAGLFLLIAKMIFD